MAMPDAEDIDIRLMTGEDIAEAMRLKAGARWNQTEVDWRRLLRLDPDGCFAASIGGKVIATTTTTMYGQRLAWVGMVLVDPEFRRRGIATMLVRVALKHLGEAGVGTVKLDATPAGVPVYEGLGFERERTIERWSGVARDGSGNRLMGDPERSGIFELDRRAFGADRARLLSTLIEDACVTASISSPTSGSLDGYALARRGTNAFYVGPVVAPDTGTCTTLLDGVLGQLSGSQIYIDLNTTFQGGAEELVNRGFRKQRELIRMRFGEKSDAGTSGSVFAIAGPEVG
ncbi:MAG TPA: GNAT family N-acetyltransferase [Pyrinomonadaceae bacterium]|nr:GNAT family N-acetyltransferase [Pyrinomonadaceae bacterium]